MTLILYLFLDTEDIAILVDIAEMSCFAEFLVSVPLCSANWNRAGSLRMSDYGVEVGVHEGDDFVFWAGVQLMVTLLLLLLTLC
jgi:hypothetical protein